MERKIVYTKEIDIYIHDLMFVLFEKEYFSFFEDAQNYVEKMLSYIEKYVGILPDKDAPSYFARYGANLKYITCRANKSTTWYILYQQQANIFLIIYITNNHFEGQYFNVE
ncbi:MAG: hypothetical protein LBS50_00980 [Prevotellaceae bacterium]|nr:hypothetical protein [Prevotellaceae bacterium]